MNDNISSLLIGAWYEGVSSFSGEAWYFMLGRRITLHNIGQPDETVKYEYDPSAKTLTLRPMIRGQITPIVWQVESPDAKTLLLSRDEPGKKTETKLMQRTVGTSGVLLRTVDLMFCGSRMIVMDRIPVDLLRVWLLCRDRSGQLGELYAHLESCLVDDEHAGLIAFLYAYKQHERMMKIQGKLQRIVERDKAFEQYLYILDTWLKLHDRYIIVGDIHPLQVERYREYVLTLSKAL